MGVVWFVCGEVVVVVVVVVVVGNAMSDCSGLAVPEME